MQGIIFDWSGTLKDNVRQFYNTTKIIFKESGGPELSFEEVRKEFTLPYMQFYNKYMPNLTKEKQCEIYLREIQKQPRAKLYPGVIEILDYLKQKNIAIFILSSDPSETCHAEIKEFGLEKYFEKVISDIHEKGPILNQLKKQYNLTADSYYIGDTFGDIDAGKNAGIKTIGISWGFQCKEGIAKANPNYLIEDIQELKEII